MIDIVLACLALLVYAPLIVILALMIKLEAPKQPILYTQTRYGRNGRPFSILKFRTMFPGADALKQGLLEHSEDKGPGFKLENDPRVTPVGRVLRRYYFDEIPQFWNVLKGDMSVVGPRANSAPPSSYKPWQRVRLSVKPGMTGTWQIARNKPVDFEKRCLMDLDYVRNKSIPGDLKIILGTVQMLMTRANGK
ncbi:sugar transferase [Tropicimonas marinistellae]|uniref:sugar transferase n=1 Tax=Tropicimonas marinistellae TaxID=1739787 RepID=UPI00122E7296|nr:sugar transferase [Tropicimonas marinistellae]